MKTTTNTELLIKKIKGNSFYKKGRESFSDGIHYRYDRFEIKNENAPNYLVSLFYKSALENGFRKTATYFSVGDDSFTYIAPNFKSEPNGKIIMTELLLNN